jgi:hypothetical protein
VPRLAPENMPTPSVLGSFLRAPPDGLHMGAARLDPKLLYCCELQIWRVSEWNESKNAMSKPIELRLTIIIPSWTKAAIALALAVLVVFGVGFGARVWAAPIAPPSYSTGDILTAKGLNDGFSGISSGVNALDARVSALEAQHVASGVVDATCNLASQSGGMSTVNNGPGDCTVVFPANAFASPPTCVATSYGVNGAFPRYAYVVKATVTASSARFKHMTVDTAIGPPNGATAAENAAFVCTGK